MPNTAGRKERKFSHSSKINEGSKSSSGKKRFSARLQRNGADGLSHSFVNSDGDFCDEEFETHTSSIKKIKRINNYGHIEGIEVGESWLTRVECSNAGVHRPTVAGIHAGNDGAYSIALSGGYADDVDYGETFIYTGAGGRDLKGTKQNPKNLRTAPQTKGQTLDNFNKSLMTSAQTKNPVRVIRGYKLGSPYAPEEGYRYDGLYTVEKAWTTVGLSGFLVYKFSLKRCDGQAPPPWMVTEPTDSTDIPPSHFHNVSGISRNDSVQAIESPSGRVESRRQPVKFHISPNQSSALLGKLDCNKEVDVHSIVNKDFIISNENSNIVSNSINENSRSKVCNLTSSYDNDNLKSKKLNSCDTSFAERKHFINKKCSQRISTVSQNCVLTKVSSSRDQKIEMSKTVGNNEQKLISERHYGESKISAHVNGLKQETSLHDVTSKLNCEKVFETSTSCLTEVCNLLKSSPSSSVLISDTEQGKCSENTRCLNTTNIEKPIVVLKKISDEQIDTIISPVHCGIGNNLKKITPKSKDITGSSNLSKSNSNSNKILTVDNISQETEFSDRKINETKLIKKTENNKDIRSNKSIKKCCVHLFRFDKQSDTSVSTVYNNAQAINKEKHNLWHGWDDIGKQDFFGFNETDLSEAWSAYFKVCNYTESLGNYVAEEECTNDEDDIWQGW